MKVTNQDEMDVESILSAEVDEAQRQAIRENAKRVLQESGLAEMLKTLNKNTLKGRGSFYEFDSMLLFKWGTSSTRRHMWIEVNGNTIRFRLAPHRKCAITAPICDGEYHTFTSAMWVNQSFLLNELNDYYARPIAETSSD
ncbi:MAG: hypothetical protein ACXVDN_00840 [Ktedonobacteraceae bacterium]